MIKSIIDSQKVDIMYHLLCDNLKDCSEVINQGKTGYCWLIAALEVILTDCGKENELNSINFQYLVYWDKYERCKQFLLNVENLISRKLYHKAQELIQIFRISDEGQWSMTLNIVNKYGIHFSEKKGLIDKLNTTELNAVLNYVLKGVAIKYLSYNMEGHRYDGCLFDFLLQDVDYVLRMYLPDAFYKEKKVTCGKSLDNYISIISSPSNIFNYKSGYRIVSEKNVDDGLPSIHYNIPKHEFCNTVKELVVNQKKIWIACDAGKFLLWNKGIFDDRIFRINQIFAGLEDLKRDDIKKSSIASMCHAMLIVGEADGSFLIKNTRGFEFGKGGYGIMSKSWFEKYVFQAIVPVGTFVEPIMERRIYDISAEQFYRNV